MKVIGNLRLGTLGQLGIAMFLSVPSEQIIEDFSS